MFCNFQIFFYEDNTTILGCDLSRCEQFCTSKSVQWLNSTLNLGICVCSRGYILNNDSRTCSGKKKLEIT
jgi:hypothetical protein